MAKGPAAPKKTPPAAAAPKAQASAPDTSPESSSAPAPDTAQDQAAAGETQQPSIPSGANGPDPVIGLRVTSEKEGFWRAGRSWSKQAIEIPLEGLTDGEIKALKDEPMLTVEEVTLP